MKYHKLVRAVTKLGWYQDKGKKHEKYRHDATSKTIQIPRHKEINEITAQRILKEAKDYIK